MSLTHDTSPFIESKLLTVYDNNTNSNYSNGQVTFEVQSNSSDGLYADFADSIVNFPMVMIIESKAEADGSATADAVNFETVIADFALGLKNSNLNIIESYSFIFDRGEVVSKQPLSNVYLNFRKNTEMTKQDEYGDADMIGYAKDSSTSWVYNDTKSEYGRGICNNANANVNLFSQSNDTDVNYGMLARQRRFRSLSGKKGASKIYQEAKLQDANDNRIINTTTHKAVHFNCLVRLGDLPFFDKMKLCKNARVKLTFNINQCFFKVTKDADGKLDFDPNSCIISGTNNTNPLMFAANSVESKNINMMGTGGKVTVPAIPPAIPAGGIAAAEVNVVVGPFTYDNKAVALSDGLVACGAAPLPLNRTYNCSLSLVKSNWNGHTTGINDAVGTHQLNKCQLEIPLYQFNDTLDVNQEELYVSDPVKSIKYYDIISVQIENIGVGKRIDNVIQNGIVNPIRLIIVPIISGVSNGVIKGGDGSFPAGGFSPLISPFASEPGTCSPYQITDFNVVMSGKSLYPEAYNYDYQEFKNTLGKFASNISLTDFNNMYGYICVDLRKRKYDINTTQSIHIKGMNSSNVNIDLLCFVEYEKEVLLNVLTGKVEEAA
jgi:hypothetical protein